MTPIQYISFSSHPTHLKINDTRNIFFSEISSENIRIRNSKSDISIATKGERLENKIQKIHKTQNLVTYVHERPKIPQ